MNEFSFQGNFILTHFICGHFLMSIFVPRIMSSKRIIALLALCVIWTVCNFSKCTMYVCDCLYYTNCDTICLMLKLGHRFSICCCISLFFTILCICTPISFRIVWWCLAHGSRHKRQSKNRFLAKLKKLGADGQSQINLKK